MVNDYKISSRIDDHLNNRYYGNSLLQYNRRHQIKLLRKFLICVAKFDAFDLDFLNYEQLLMRFGYYLYMNPRMRIEFYVYRTAFWHKPTFQIVVDGKLKLPDVKHGQLVRWDSTAFELVNIFVTTLAFLGMGALLSIHLIQ